MAAEETGYEYERILNVEDLMTLALNQVIQYTLTLSLTKLQITFKLEKTSSKLTNTVNGFIMSS